MDADAVVVGAGIAGLVWGTGPGVVAPFERRVKQHGEDFVVAESLTDLVHGMNEKADPEVPPIDEAALGTLIEDRDREIANDFGKDAQLTATRGARGYRGDRLIRVAAPHRLLDPSAGPLIAVRLNVLTRKTLGGLHTDLDGRVLGADGAPVPGLHAAGERVRRRRDARLQRTRGHVPGRLPVLRPDGGPRRCGPGRLTGSALVHRKGDLLGGSVGERHLEPQW